MPQVVAIEPYYMNDSIEFAHIVPWHFEEKWLSIFFAPLSSPVHHGFEQLHHGVDGRRKEVGAEPQAVGHTHQ